MPIGPLLKDPAHPEDRVFVIGASDDLHAHGKGIHYTGRNRQSRVTGDIPYAGEQKRHEG